MKKLRKIPLVCLFASIFKLLIVRLQFSSHFKGKLIKMKDGQNFIIFRHITKHPYINDQHNVVFIVSFKFARLSHKQNKIASLIPMLLISGFPGFITKIYAVNPDNGYWQGMYEWKSKQALEDYKKSFVFKMMNKRAIESSITSFEKENQSLSAIIEEMIITR